MDKKTKLVLETFISVIVVTVLITLMIRSYILKEWFFGGGYLFVLISLAKFKDVRDEFDKVDKINSLKDNLGKLQKMAEDLKDKDGEEENDE